MDPVNLSILWKFNKSTIYLDYLRLESFSKEFKEYYKFRES